MELQHQSAASSLPEIACVWYKLKSPRSTPCRYQDYARIKIDMVDLPDWDLDLG